MTFLLNSKFEPIESPKNAPIIIPNIFFSFALRGFIYWYGVSPCCLFLDIIISSLSSKWKSYCGDCCFWFVWLICEIALFVSLTYFSLLNAIMVATTTAATTKIVKNTTMMILYSSIIYYMWILILIYLGSYLASRMACVFSFKKLY